MPRRAVNRMLMVIFLATVAALWAPATAAQADNPCCSASLSGVPGTFQAGADPLIMNAAFNVTPVLDPRSAFRTISARVDIAATDLVGSQVKLAWRPTGGNGSWHSISVGRHDGVLTGSFQPYQDVKNFGPTSDDLRLSFSSKATGQNIAMALDLLGSTRHGNAQQLSRSGPFASSIQAAQITPTPTPTPTPTIAPVVPVPTPTPTPTATPTTATPTDTAPAAAATSATPTTVAALPAAAGPGDGDAGGSSAGWIFYIIGGLLLLAGIGVVGTMLWKRTVAAAPTEWPDPNDPSLYGDYPPQAQAFPPAQAVYPPAQPAYPPSQPAYPPPPAGNVPLTDPTRPMPGL